MTREEMIKALADWHYADMVAGEDFDGIELIAKRYLSERYDGVPTDEIQAIYTMLMEGAEQ